MAFVALDGLTGKLTDTLVASNSFFTANPSFVHSLETSLATDGDYSFLSIIGKTGGYEIVKVTNVDGELILDRGEGNTTAINAAIGSCIKFETSTVVLAEMIANGGIEPPVCEIVAGDGISIEKDGCVHTVSVVWPECDPYEFMGASFNVVDGCLVVEEPDRCNCDPVDGTYENATVTIRDGRICAIQTGPNPQYLAPSCTCCNCSEQDTQV